MVVISIFQPDPISYILFCQEIFFAPGETTYACLPIGRIGFQIYFSHEKHRGHGERQFVLELMKNHLERKAQ